MKTKTMVATLALALAGGCVSARNSAVPMVPDVGVDVVTRHRYRVTRVYDGETSKASGIRTAFLSRLQPRIFSSGGIPVVLRIASPRMDASSSWTTLFAMCSIGVFPMLMQVSYTFSCSVELPDENGSAPFELLSRQDDADTWLPTAYLFYNGTPDFDGHRVFCEHTTICGNKSYFHIPYEFDQQTAEMTGLDNMLQRALAYGIAVKLKELEDSGKVDAMLRKQAEQRSAAPAHRVVKLEREPGSEFIHSFAIEILRMPSDERSAVKAVLKEFVASLKEDYLDTFPSARREALVVSISGLKCEGQSISGRAAVLTIKPLSLVYDQNTRRGKLSVRFNVGQEDEARAWIRRNVKTLARDKNIALTTGQIPPAAKFYLGREELKDGNVLEIEFRTE